ncbi:ChbG/HpnK family deacetylase [Paenibacillus sp. GCM10023252]|uniref:ChbG/HpnK family deacetylase n=1 Tax=Paenibacillus sp. GCM10023252 TaxID=3252649 RepID=UPI00361CBC4C
MRQGNIYLLTQGDDLGSSRSANQAIIEAYEQGVMRNTSFMTACEHAADAAKLLAAQSSGLCIGLHCTVNAEWDRVRWKPVLPASEVPSLVREDGSFHRSPVHMRDAGFKLEELMAELQAQLDYARQLGVQPVYADTHMRFEWVDERIAPTFDAWCEREGLISYRSYYRELPPAPADVSRRDPVEQFLSRLDAAEPGLYGFLAHPAYDDEETRCLGNEQVSGSEVAESREWERRLFTDPRVLAYFEENSVVPVTYLEAAQLVLEKHRF